MVWQIVIAAIGSAGLFTFVEFLIKRHDNRKGHIAKLEQGIEELKQAQHKNEKDSVRLQLIMLLNLQPTARQEIIKCAEHYFGELKGDWYMTSLFNNWLESNGIGKPEWFDREG